jgi:hypothetical protein
MKNSNIFFRSSEKTKMSLKLEDEDLDIWFENAETLAAYLDRLPSVEGLKIVYREVDVTVLAKYEHLLVLAECPGCEDNQPNQEAHIGKWGCLGEW